MPVNEKKRNFYIIVIVIALLVAGAIYVGKRWGRFADRQRDDVFGHRSNDHGRRSEDTTTGLPTPPKDTIPMPDTARWLSDSTHVFLMKDTRLTPVKSYPVHREVNVDGDVFFEVPAASQPLIIKTKLLTLSVTGKAAFRVLAPAKEEWSEVQMISGNIIVKKAYPSDYKEPDTLHDDQMVMINRTIDLMEKEKFDATDLKAWRTKLP